MMHQQTTVDGDKKKLEIKRRRLYVHSKEADARDAFGGICFDTSVVFPYTFSDENGRQALMLYDLFGSNCYELFDFGLKDVVSILGCDKAVLFQLEGNPDVLDGAKYVVFQMVQRALITFEPDAFHVRARYVPVKNNKHLKNYTNMLDLTAQPFRRTVLKLVASNNEGCFATAYDFYIYRRHPTDPSKTNMYIMDVEFNGFTPKQVTLDFLIIDAVAGQNHVVLLDDKGRLHVHGIGLHGELGLGASTTKAEKDFILNESIAEQIPDGIAKIVACNHFNAVLSRNGDVFVWGWNRSYGDLPGVDKSVYFDPMPLDLTENATDIELHGATFTVALGMSFLLYIFVSILFF
uniref:Regulator of chromosome condensation (RCC1) family protein n=1 Tax=Panagrellus redivivus TaxID=6233 RepID=A0A7E4VMU0_PANRE